MRSTRDNSISVVSWSYNRTESLEFNTEKLLVFLRNFFDDIYKNVIDNTVTDPLVEFIYNKNKPEKVKSITIEIIFSQNMPLPPNPVSFKLAELQNIPQLLKKIEENLIYPAEPAKIVFYSNESGSQVNSIIEYALLLTHKKDNPLPRKMIFTAENALNQYYQEQAIIALKKEDIDINDIKFLQHMITKKLIDMQDQAIIAVKNGKTDYLKDIIRNNKDNILIDLSREIEISKLKKEVCSEADKTLLIHAHQQFKKHLPKKPTTTLAHLAAFYGQSEIINLLAEYDHQLLTREDNMGWTPAHLAAEFGHLEVLQKLNDIFNARERKVWNQTLEEWYMPKGGILSGSICKGEDIITPLFLAKQKRDEEKHITSENKYVKVARFLSDIVQAHGKALKPKLEKFVQESESDTQEKQKQLEELVQKSESDRQKEQKQRELEERKMLGIEREEPCSAKSTEITIESSVEHTVNLLPQEIKSEPPKKPSYFEGNPNVKRALIGGLIGLGIVLAVGLVVFAGPYILAALGITAVLSIPIAIAAPSAVACVIGGGLTGFGLSALLGKSTGKLQEMHKPTLQTKENCELFDHDNNEGKNKDIEPDISVVHTIKNTKQTIAGEEEAFGQPPRSNLRNNSMFSAGNKHTDNQNKIQIEEDPTNKHIDTPPTCTIL